MSHLKSVTLEKCHTAADDFKTTMKFFFDLRGFSNVAKKIAKNENVNKYIWRQKALKIFTFDSFF